MAASLPNEAEFGFWPPRFLKQKPVVLFCFFTSPEGQLPRRGIVVIGAGPIHMPLWGPRVRVGLKYRTPGYGPSPLPAAATLFLPPGEASLTVDPE